jgi:hypothetical protein
MRRFAAVSTVMVVAAIAALFLTSLVRSAEEEPGPKLAAARSVVRPGIKTVGPVRVTGQVKKGLGRADLNKLKAPPEDSRRIRIPKARVHTVKESTSVLSKLKGGQAFLKSVPVPTSGALPDNANLLLTPLKPSGSLSGVKSTRIYLTGVRMGYGDDSLEISASQDRVCIRSPEYGGAVGVLLSDMEPGWYIVAGDFVAYSDGTHVLRSTWHLTEEGSGRNGGEFEISSTLKRGDELFLPVMLQLTRLNPQAFVNFFPRGERVSQFWFRSVSVQKLN